MPLSLVGRFWGITVIMSRLFAHYLLDPIAIEYLRINEFVYSQINFGIIEWRFQEIYIVGARTIFIQLWLTFHRVVNLE